MTRVSYKASINTRSNRRFGAILAACLCLGLVSWAFTDSSAAVQKEPVMPIHASGMFDVKLTPQTDQGGDPALGRMLVDKQYHGDLEGSSKGQMLTAGEAKSSGVYVAIEKFSGTLKGRSGTFILHHTGIMTRGTPQLSITVAPDSGTGQLAGLTGKMMINIADGKHSYEFEYTLPESH
jgi:Protein of unknown function (DUF3224)